MRSRISLLLLLLLLLLLSFSLPFAAFSQVQWSQHTITGSADGARRIHAVDLDADGDTDIITGASSVGMSWWENDGSELFTEHTIIELSNNNYDWIHDIHTSDINGDQHIDIIVSYQIEGPGGGTILFANNGDQLFTEYVITSGIYMDLESFDVNNDGYKDIICIWGGLVWFQNIDGSGQYWEQYLLDIEFSHGNSVSIADLDSDGDNDIIGCGGESTPFPSGQVSWWENDGNGSFIVHSVDSGRDGANCVYTEDIDGDGDTDILCTSFIQVNPWLHIVNWYENVDGTGSLWHSRTIDNDFQSPSKVVAKDINLDERVDVIASGSQNISWWENDDLFTWTEHTVTNAFDDAEDVFVADVDSDEDPDILGAAYGADDFAWWEQLGVPYFDLELLAPNGSETWRIDTPHDIAWLSTSQNDICLELLQGNTVERVIEPATQNDGLYQWIIPVDAVPGDDYRIRISLTDDTEADTSDAEFAITSLPTVTLTPYLPPIVIPDFGGGFWYWLVIANPSPFPGSGQYWAEVIIPNGYTFGPLYVLPRTLQPWEVFAPAEPTSQWVPAYAPSGVYQFVMHVGMYPNLIVSTDSFEFEKLAGIAAASQPESSWLVTDWQNADWKQAASSEAWHDHPPAEYTIWPAYPNPFNSTTSFTVVLPEASILKATVHDVLGREVDQLAAGNYTAGQHRMTFDASHLASGLYFIQVAASGYSVEVQKVMLVR